MDEEKLQSSVQFVEMDDMLDHIFNPDTRIQSIEAHKGTVDSHSIVEETTIPGAYLRYSNYDPKYERRYRKDTYPFYKLGHDNKYPFMLVDMLTQSSLHKSAWKSSVNAAYGKGWASKGEGGADYLKWLQNKGLDLWSTRQALEQLSAFGGFYPYFVFVNNMNDRGRVFKKLKRIEIGKYTHYRVGKEELEGENIGETLYHWFHPNYNQERLSKRFLKGVPTYTTIAEIQEDSRYLVKEDKETPYYEGKQALLNLNRYTMLVGDAPSLFSEYYPSPSYESNGALHSIQIGAALANFDLAGLKNGLSAGYIVTVPLANTSRRNPEEYKKKQDAARELVKEHLEGEDNNKRTLILFEDPKNQGGGVKISQIPHTNTSDIHDGIYSRSVKNVLTAWKVPDPRLIGSPPEESKGVTNQAEVLEVAEDIWYNLNILPELVQILETFVNTTLKSIYLFETGQDESEAEVFLLRNKMFSKLPSDELLKKDFLRKERRKLYGAAPLTDEEEELLRAEKEEELQRQIRLRAAGVYQPEDDPAAGDTPEDLPSDEDDVPALPEAPQDPEEEEDTSSILPLAKLRNK